MYTYNVMDKILEMVFLSLVFSHISFHPLTQETRYDHSLYLRGSFVDLRKAQYSQEHVRGLYKQMAACY